MSAKTIRQLHAQTPLPTLELRMITELVLDVPRSWLIAHDTDELSERDLQSINTLIKRRLDGEPMAYLLGHREFMSLNFVVTPDVLIPRPDTEVLAQKAIDLISTMQASLSRPVRALDVGTGSGALAVSIKHYCPQIVMTASDISPQALNIARQNAANHHLNIRFVESDVFSALDSGVDSFDIIISNPPYIEAYDDHLQQGDLRFEPQISLTDDADGLRIIRTLVQKAGEFLVSDGTLWIEHGWKQGPAVQTLFQQNGYTEIQTLRDHGDNDRVTGGKFA